MHAKIINIHTIPFPRQLEADGSAEKIRSTLAQHLVRLHPESRLELPSLELTESMIKAIRKANLQRRVRLGLDEILERLSAEKKGIDELRQKTAAPQAERISRLILFSKDGAERFYRNVEHTLAEHSPRIFGCMLNVDGSEIGRIITGKNIAVKVILIEHKDAVSDVLRSLI